MRTIRCSVAYHQSKLDELPFFAGGVENGVYNDPVAFPTPPILQTAFLELIQTYANTRSIYKQGGLAQKGPFLAAKNALMEGLDLLAEYVDSIANGDANIITIAGFVPTKGVVSNTPVPVQVEGVKLVRGSVGELTAECNKQAGVISYCCIMTVGQPLPPNIIINDAGQMQINTQEPIPSEAALAATITSGGVIDFNTNRKKTFIGLTPGIIYYFKFFGINASGVGTLSASAHIMCG